MKVILTRQHARTEFVAGLKPLSSENQEIFDKLKGETFFVNDDNLYATVFGFNAQGNLVMKKYGPDDDQKGTVTERSTELKQATDGTVIMILDSSDTYPLKPFSDQVFSVDTSYEYAKDNTVAHSIMGLTSLSGFAGYGNAPKGIVEVEVIPSRQ